MSTEPGSSELHRAIGAWDGKTIVDLEDIGARFSARTAYFEDLVSLTADTKRQRGATWLILNALRSGTSPSSHWETALLHSLPLLEDAQACLHLLQSLPYLSIPESCRQGVESFVRASLTASNKFVRAWAYSGLHELALRFPQYEKETTQIFAMAMKDEAPSVKARIRQLTSRGQ